MSIIAGSVLVSVSSRRYYWPDVSRNECTKKARLVNTIAPPNKYISNRWKNPHFIERPAGLFD